MFLMIVSQSAFHKVEHMSKWPLFLGKRVHGSSLCWGNGGLNTLRCGFFHQIFWILLYVHLWRSREKLYVCVSMSSMFVCVCVCVSTFLSISRYSCFKVALSNIAADSYFTSQKLDFHSLFSLSSFYNGFSPVPSWWVPLVDSSKGYTRKTANRNVCGSFSKCYPPHTG